MLKTAVIQMVSSDQLSHNLATATTLIEEAKNADAQFVALPENFAFMGKQDIDMLTIMETKGEGKIQTFLATEAKRHQLWLLGGSVPLTSKNAERAYSASLLYAPNGECYAHYNKIHLFDVSVNENESYCESNTFEAGHEVVVAATEIANIGLSICYDLRFPELYRNMHNAHILTVPAAFTYTTGNMHWQPLLCARAIENQCYVVAPNQGGIHANQRSTWGHSMIIDPLGKVLATIENGVGIALAELNFTQQTQLRQQFPVLNHRRLNN